MSEDHAEGLFQRGRGIQVQWLGGDGHPPRRRIQSNLDGGAAGLDRCEKSPEAGFEDAAQFRRIGEDPGPGTEDVDVTDEGVDGNLPGKVGWPGRGRRQYSKALEMR
ncbi:MAG: hypothetical protein Q9Q13_03400 [Acidobacteriota bacterium]|nr:hypothetical protein [Acidobacteriota bacterium]